jgi:alanine racemase
MVGDTSLLKNFDLIPLINSAEQLAFHAENSADQSIGIQLDTGMNRLGMEGAEFEAIKDIILKLNPALIISHLACADEPSHPMNEKQLNYFNAITDNIDCKKSLAATGGILLGKRYHFDMTRPGIGLYGGNPYSGSKNVIGLKLPVIQIRSVLPNETVGYSNTWTAKEITKVATVSSGYADGIFRCLSGKAMLYYDQIPCNIIGRISMDLIGVDVSNCGENPDHLWLLNDIQSIDDLADDANSIGYEILTALGQRYNRSYI